MTAQAPAIANDHLTTNLAALEKAQPDPARVIRTTRIPPNVVPVTARDGCATYQLTDKAGQRVWFGRTSMPSISAAELLANIGSERGGVILPEILSGREVLTIADRLPRHAAAFVLEQDALHLRLAMTLYDYSAEIAAGRLIFICGTEPSEQLVQFFANNPGYEFPSNVFHPPHVTKSSARALQDQIERAGERVLAEYARHLQDAKTRIDEQYHAPRKRSATPSVAVLGLDPGSTSIDFARQLARGIKAMGASHAVCVPDAPRRCHAVARMQAIANAKATAVVFVNSSPGEFRGLLPKEMPVVSWFPPDLAPPRCAPAHAGPSDVVFCSSPTHQQSLVELGHAARLIAPAVDGTLFFSESSQPHNIESRSGTVLLCDLPRDRADDLRLSLPSQVSLWNALCEAAADQIREGIAPTTLSLLDEAQLRSGTQITDDDLRGTLTDLAESTVLPAARARATVRALQAANCDIQIYGHNWHREQEFAQLHRGPIPLAAGRADLFRAVQSIVIPVSTEAAIQYALEALACAAQVLLAAPPQPLADHYPGLSDVLNYIKLCENPAGFSAALRRNFDPAIAEAADRIATAHTFAHRLKEVMKCSPDS